VQQQGRAREVGHAQHQHHRNREQATDGQAEDDRHGGHQWPERWSQGGESELLAEHAPTDGQKMRRRVDAADEGAHGTLAIHDLIDGFIALSNIAQFSVAIGDQDLLDASAEIGDLDDHAFLVFDRVEVNFLAVDFFLKVDGTKFDKSRLFLWCFAGGEYGVRRK